MEKDISPIAPVTLRVWGLDKDASDRVFEAFAVEHRGTRFTAVFVVASIERQGIRLPSDADAEAAFEIAEVERRTNGGRVTVMAFKLREEEKPCLQVLTAFELARAGSVIYFCCEDWEMVNTALWSLYNDPLVTFLDWDWRMSGVSWGIH
jgi:hypothetical protein